MLLTLVVGLGENIFAQLQIDPDTLTVRGALGIALGAVVLMVLALTSSRLASDLATGTPRLGALDAALAVGGTAAAGGYVARQTLRTSGQLYRGSKLAATKAASAIKRSASKRSSSEGSGDES